MNYQLAGEERLLALGVYGEVSLKQAREERDVARTQLADGIGPGAPRISAFKRARSS